jgi:glycosyltransferase involved in cell wall biosynthesis
MSRNKFVFVIPAYNARETVCQMLTSLVAQCYPFWRAVIIDDISTDGTPDVIETFCNSLGISDRITLIRNSEKKWEVENVLMGINLCEEDEIVCRLDADDWLCDNDALAIINDRYSKLPIDVLWTAHRWSFTDINISGHLPRGSNPYVHPWVSSHLKTFRKSLITGVHDQNFRGTDGKYFKRIGDQAIYLPVLAVSRGWHYEPIVAYHYTIDLSPQTFQTDDARFQKAEAEFLRSRGFVK